MPVVTPAEPQHGQSIAELFEELDRFYGETVLEPFDDRVQQIKEALFGEPPAAYALLAWEGAELVGVACYSFLWPAVRVTRSLFLKELYVAQAYRRTGVGNLLMDGLIDIAKRHNCSRVEWMTDLGNRNAQDFYEARGVEVDTTKLFYRVSL